MTAADISSTAHPSARLARASMMLGRIGPGTAAVLLAVLGRVRIAIGNVALPRLGRAMLNLSLSVTVLCLCLGGALGDVAGMVLAVPHAAILVLTVARFNAIRQVSVVVSGMGLQADNPASPLGPAAPAHLHQHKEKRP